METEAVRNASVEKTVKDAAWGKYIAAIERLDTANERVKKIRAQLRTAIYFRDSANSAYDEADNALLEAFRTPGAE